MFFCIFCMLFNWCGTKCVTVSLEQVLGIGTCFATSFLCDLEQIAACLSLLPYLHKRRMAGSTFQKCQRAGLANVL